MSGRFFFGRKGLLCAGVSNWFITSKGIGAGLEICKEATETRDKADHVPNHYAYGSADSHSAALKFQAQARTIGDLQRGRLRRIRQTETKESRTSQGGNSERRQEKAQEIGQI
jgi:hypothetical protein